MFPIIEASQNKFDRFVSTLIFVDFLGSPEIKSNSKLT